MTSISPSHVVKYNLNVDPSRPLMKEEKYKSLAISEAKAIFILYEHETNTADYEKYLTIRENIIIDNYTPNTVILVEEDSTLKKENLRCRWLINMKPSDYNIIGWDDPEACLKRRKIGLVQSAVEDIFEFKNPEISQIESWNILKDFSRIKKNPYLSEEEIDAQLSKKLTKPDLIFERKKTLFSFKLQTDLANTVTEHIYETFQQRQDLLFQTVEKNLTEGRSIILICGKSHGNCSDKKIAPIVDNFFNQLNQLNHTYVVIDPSIKPPVRQSKSI